MAWLGLDELKQAPAILPAGPPLSALWLLTSLMCASLWPLITDLPCMWLPVTSDYWPPVYVPPCDLWLLTSRMCASLWPLITDLPCVCLPVTSDYWPPVYVPPCDLWLLTSRMCASLWPLITDLPYVCLPVTSDYWPPVYVPPCDLWLLTSRMCASLWLLITDLPCVCLPVTSDYWPPVYVPPCDLWLLTSRMCASLWPLITDLPCMCLPVTSDYWPPVCVPPCDLWLLTSRMCASLWPLITDLTCVCLSDCLMVCLQNNELIRQILAIFLQRCQPLLGRSRGPDVFISIHIHLHQFILQWEDLVGEFKLGGFFLLLQLVVLDLHIHQRLRHLSWNTKSDTLLSHLSQNTKPELTHCGLVTPYGDINGSTLVQVMACCLTAPSHYLNQCWLIISEVQRQSPEGNFTRNTSAINN